ncbi:hypothetical protein FA15DRAFT_674688 [Coprinopsis marcescibilis]|uniref:Uncharacterized protein n=1 Tax=Coprinopsis marcescibilis TaxID=230819 RepID=A0A5C3KG35_COPMA|nr:hypothetical protein FA15DRAFT_674688 [Coprinopsis marcescibilis]
MLYEAPRLAGSEWDPSVRRDMQELFDAMKENELEPNHKYQEFPGFGEGGPVSRGYLKGWFEEILKQQPLCNIYPWPGEAVGVNLRFLRDEDDEGETYEDSD